MTLAPGTRFGPYQIIGQLGQGGMATVYKAYHPALERYVAIKVLPDFFARQPGFRERFRREAVAVARLRHPNILTVFDHGQEGELTYIVNELVEGGTLADGLGAAVSVTDVVRLLAPVASALDYAHAEGVLHRDVKPSNILLDRHGGPILGDFGLARVMDAAEKLTQTGTVLGTPEYMSPEQCAGEEPGPATDVYSLAVVAYEMLTGRVPIRAATPMAVILAQMRDPLPPPRSVNPELDERIEAALLKGLAKAPADRWTKAADLVEALRPLPARAAPTLLTPPARPSRRTLLIGGGAVTLLTLAGVGAAAILPRLVQRPGPSKSRGPAASPSATPISSPSPVPRGPLLYQAALDGSLSDLRNTYVLGDPAASTIVAAPGSLEFRGTANNSGRGAILNMPALGRYLGEIELSGSGLSLYFEWMLRSGDDLQIGKHVLVLESFPQTVKLVYYAPGASANMPLATPFSVLGLRSGRKLTLTALVDPPRFVIYVDQRQAIDASDPVAGRNTVTGRMGFHIGMGTVILTGARAYGLA